MSKRGRDPYKRKETPPSSDNGSRQILDGLSRSQMLELTAAFDTAAGGSVNNDQLPKAKKRRVTGGSKKGKETVKQQAAGGFLLDDEEDTAATGGGFIHDDDTAAGGFIPEPGPSSSSRRTSRLEVGDTTDEDADEQSRRPRSILLDRVSACLDQLGFDGDDPNILSILENAAEPNEEGLQVVKRKDFLKVAALLIVQRDIDSDGSTKKTRSASSRKGRSKETENDDDDNDSDPLELSSDLSDYDLPNDEDSDPWADEDGIEASIGKESSPPSTRRTTRSQATVSTPEPGSFSNVKPKARGNDKASIKKAEAGNANDKKYSRLSEKQTKECEHMFQQFFSSTDTSRNKAISASEIRYVATLLNEKISDADVSLVTANENMLLSTCEDAETMMSYQVYEMLEFASTSRDKAVNLEAFSRIMVDVKAV